MRKIILMMSVSLDGFFEGPDRDINWHLVDEELHQHFNDESRAMGAFMGGGITYELMAGFWPTADQDPDKSAVMAEFARIWREMPKFVFSRTLTDAAWNAKVIRDVVPEKIAELKARPGGLRPSRGAGPGTAAVPVPGYQDEPPVRRVPDLRQRGAALLQARAGLTRCSAAGLQAGLSCWAAARPSREPVRGRS